MHPVYVKVRSSFLSTGRAAEIRGHPGQQLEVVSVLDCAPLPVSLHRPDGLLG